MERNRSSRSTIDARELLSGLIGQTIRTVTGRPNTVLDVRDHHVLVATERSPGGAPVPVEWVQTALDRLKTDGSIEVSVKSLRHRSAFVGAVLLTLPEAAATRTSPPRIELGEPVRADLSHWLKIEYSEGTEDDRDYWSSRRYVSDGPGGKSPRWRHRRRPRKGQSYPPFGPRYAIGDQLVVCVTPRDRRVDGLRGCLAILEVDAEPRWDPELVDADGQPGDGDRWGVVTEVHCVAALDPKDAVSPETIGIPQASLAQKDHIRLDESQYSEAERALGLGPPTTRRERARADLVPLEAGNVAGYELHSRERRQRAERRESRLVSGYARYLIGQGDEVKSNSLVPAGATTPLRSDLFNVTRNQLIEAKAGTTRTEVRMAIGQLADYVRFLKPRPCCAVLLEAMPRSDLVNLLALQSIAIIWREGDTFRDNARGAFT